MAHFLKKIVITLMVYKYLLTVHKSISQMQMGLVFEGG